MSPSATDLAKRVSSIASAIIVVFVAIAIVAGAAIAGVSYLTRRNEAATVHEARPRIAAAEFQLSRFTPIGKSTRFRAELTELDTSARLTSYPSGDRSRNLLFADSATGATHWLLPNNEQRIVKLEDLPDGWGSDKPPPLVTIALVKPAVEPLAATTGKLLLLTPDGELVVEAATDVRDVSGCSLHEDGAGVHPPLVSIVYERNRRFVAAQYDVKTLTLVHESDLALPTVP
jgi:hypothetical protein